MSYNSFSQTFRSEIIRLYCLYYFTVVVTHRFLLFKEKWDNIVAQEHTQVLHEKCSEDAVSAEIKMNKEPVTVSLPVESSSSMEYGRPGIVCERRHSVPQSLPRTVARILPHTDTLRRQSTIWTSSLSTIASNVAEELFSSTSSITSKRYLTKQNTFPPPPLWHSRLHQRQAAIIPQLTPDSSREEGDHKTRTYISISENVEKTSERHCPTNGCSAPTSCDYDSITEGKVVESETLTPRNDDHFSVSLKMRYNSERDARIVSLTKRATERKSKPLIRLKSDSDLLQHNGKILFGPKSTSVKNKEEKENANPIMKTWQWRNTCRKIKSQVT